MQGHTFYSQRQHAEALDRKNEARRLRSQGHSVKEIAKRLDRSVFRVRDYLGGQERSATKASVSPLVSVEEKTEAMQAVYPPGDVRRDWIREQMQAWAARRQR